VGRKKQKSEGKLLTDLELEVMQALWDLGEGTVKDVLGKMTGRELAYTSVATVLKILENKKVVVSLKTERALLYRPLVTRDKYEKKSVQHLLGRIFRSGPSRLVMRLLDEADFSAEELRSIRSLLDERLKK